MPGGQINDFLQKGNRKKLSQCPDLLATRCLILFRKSCALVTSLTLQGLLHSGGPPSGRVHPNLGRVRPQRHGPHPFLRDVRHVEEHGPAPGVRVQVSRPSGLQETHPNEHAARQRRKSPLHHNTVCSDQVGSVYICNI